jgi:hypothetical protein
MLAPTFPLPGLTPDIVGVVVAVNKIPLLATPPTVTTIFPVITPDGAVALIVVILQLVVVAATPSNVTVLVPWAVPKFEPVMRTLAPAPPDVGLIPETEGAVVTVKANPLLATPPTVTTIFPVVAPIGTVALIAVMLQLVIAAATPLNVTVLAPSLEPKLDPAM